MEMISLLIVSVLSSDDEEEEEEALVLLSFLLSDAIVNVHVEFGTLFSFC